MALIMVVLMLALMLTFMLAVYSMSDSELKGAHQYVNGQQVRQFGDLAVDVAISQVRKGTTPVSGTEGREVWTSQPGLIRQYHASGELLAGYKLYSSSQMVVAGGTGANAEQKLINDAPPGNWQELKARYVDLNRPIHRVDGKGVSTLHFPIIDPRAMTGGSDTVSGFSYSDKLANGNTIAGVKTSGGDAQRLPMPVEWLYVLEDGTLGTLDAANKFVGAVVPTKDNPIVGRVAFWTDDETSKVNINTASEPTPWAVPTFFHEEDASFARYQPVNGELQRYPGHPATTALSPILFPGKTLTVAEKNLIYDIAPKIGRGGTYSGTVSYQDKDIEQIKLGQYRKERLYASLDELLLREDRTPNDFGLDTTAAEALQRKRFFLTAHSRAPELNLHGLPKIALWPVSYRGADYSTSFDQLIAFCSTLRQQGASKTRKYIFQRGYADSTTQDITLPENLALLEYLNSLLEKPLPGFASNPAENFSTKYGEDLRQILVEVFDYVRGTNLHDGNLVAAAPPLENATQNILLGYASGSSRPENFKTFTDPRFFQVDADSEDADASGVKEALGYPGHGQVTPSQWNVGNKIYQGIGRFPTITEVGLHFICAADNTDDPENPDVERYAAIGKPGGRSARTLDGVTPQARWYSNFPPLPKPNPIATAAKDRKADLGLYPLTQGFPYGPSTTHPGYQRENWNHQLDENKPLQPGYRRVQSRLLLEFFVPSAGYTIIEPEFTVKVSGLSQFTVNGVSLFPRNTEVIYSGRRSKHVGAQQVGGYGMGLKGILNNREAPARTPMPADANWGSDEWKVKPGSSTDDDLSVLNYNLLSNFVDINVGRDGKLPMNVSQGRLVIEIWSGHIGRNASGATPPVLVQTLRPTMPANQTMAPTLVRNPIAISGTQPGVEAPSWWTFYARGCMGINNRDEIATRSKLGPQPYTSPADVDKRKQMKGRYFSTSVQPRVGNEPRRGAIFYGFDAEDSVTRLFRPQNPLSANVADAEEREGSDVVQTVTIRHGDYRLTAAMPVVDADQWEKHRYYGKRRLAHSFTNFVSNQFPGYDYGTSNDYGKRLVATTQSGTYPPARVPDLPYLDDAVNTAQALGDFDNGLGPARDGPYINKPDEGNVNAVVNGVAYFSEAGQHTTMDDVFFTPNRLISSPVVLGSLPTGVKSGKPWRTLQFRPQQGHPGGPAKLGGVNPPDHLLLEYFWMPVVEPYAISEPLSTAGKVNLNHQILPFTNIRRTSALHALLASERVTAVPTSDAANYKAFPNANDPNQFWTTAGGKRWHYKIDAEKTLAQLDTRFKAGEACLSPSEICDIHLVPTQDAESHTQMEAFWSTRRLTGDNTRERPYATLYPRLTTRSNSYRVHYIAQVIRKARSTAPDEVTEADKFHSEHRGSSVIERYLDPAQAGLPDFTTSTADSTVSLDNHYQYRVVEKRKFGN